MTRLAACLLGSMLTCSAYAQNAPLGMPDSRLMTEEYKSSTK